MGHSLTPINLCNHIVALHKMVQALAWAMTALYLKEEHAPQAAAAAAKAKEQEAADANAASASAVSKDVGETMAVAMQAMAASQPGDEDADEKGWWEILSSKHVVVASALYWVYAIPGIITVEALPLWALTAPATGGFCFQPTEIGNLMMVHAVVILTFQAFVSRPPLLRVLDGAPSVRVGCRRFFISPARKECALTNPVLTCMTHSSIISLSQLLLVSLSFPVVASQAYSPLTDMLGFAETYKHSVLHMVVTCILLPVISSLPG